METLRGELTYHFMLPCLSSLSQIHAITYIAIYTKRWPEHVLNLQKGQISSPESIESCSFSGCLANSFARRAGSCRKPDRSWTKSGGGVEMKTNKSGWNMVQPLWLLATTKNNNKKVCFKQIWPRHNAQPANPTTLPGLSPTNRPQMPLPSVQVPIL